MVRNWRDGLPNKLTVFALQEGGFSRRFSVIAHPGVERYSDALPLAEIGRHLVYQIRREEEQHAWLQIVGKFGDAIRASEIGIAAVHIAAADGAGVQEPQRAIIDHARGSRIAWVHAVHPRPGCH